MAAKKSANGVGATTPARRSWRLRLRRRTIVTTGITPPLGESLAEARIRVSAFYDEEIIPRLSRGMRPLIVAHGNILRALTMRIENADTSGENIASLEIPTGAPLVYELDANLHPLSRKFLD